MKDMNKIYQTPATTLFKVKAENALCNGTVQGVGTTASLNTTIDDTTTDSYLSKSNSLWDDEE